MTTPDPLLPELIAELNAPSRERLIGVRHLASTGRISGWMPIESAPHGVNILVFVPEFADNGEDNSFMASGYCEDDGRFIPHEGEGDYEPTHWLPLPQPPEVKE